MYVVKNTLGSLEIFLQKQTTRKPLMLERVPFFSEELKVNAIVMFIGYNHQEKVLRMNDPINHIQTTESTNPQIYLHVIKTNV